MRLSFDRMARRTATLGVALACVIATARPGDAHPMPQTIVLLDFRADGIGAELRLPADRLEIGFGHPLSGDLRASVRQHRSALEAYVTEHISAASVDGRVWTTIVDSVHVLDSDPSHVVAHVRLRAPTGASTRRFLFQYDVIQHQLVTHVALVSVRSDWNTGTVAGAPQLLGTMGYAETVRLIDRPVGSTWNGARSVLLLGMRHIAAGTDHLLFLLVLLLPASLAATAGRWRGYVGANRSFRRLVAIVTAFTIGHSITLAAGSLDSFRAPAQIVEVLIAVSILVSAVHALRPLFPGREMIVAGSFGLVHGLAFASVVAEFNLDRWQAALSIFAFNAGIEIMQLAVVLATVPWLLLLARTRVYAAVRIAGGTVAALVAAAWVGERAAGLANPFTPIVDAIAANPLWCLTALATGSLIALGAEWRLRRTQSTSSPERWVLSPLDAES